MTNDELLFVEEIATGCYYHSVPVDFKTKDIVAVERGYTHESPEGFASINISGTVIMFNGDRYRVDGWCDTTGWDCQSDLEVVKLA